MSDNTIINRMMKREPQLARIYEMADTGSISMYDQELGFYIQKGLYALSPLRPDRIRYAAYVTHSNLPKDVEDVQFKDAQVWEEASDSAESHCGVYYIGNNLKCKGETRMVSLDFIGILLTAKYHSDVSIYVKNPERREVFIKVMENIRKLTPAISQKSPQQIEYTQPRSNNNDGLISYKKISDQYQINRYNQFVIDGVEHGTRLNMKNPTDQFIITDQILDEIELLYQKYVDYMSNIKKANQHIISEIDRLLAPYNIASNFK